MVTGIYNPQVFQPKVFKPGSYRITFHFADTSPRVRVPGERVFDVSLEGKPVLDAYDIVAAVGWSAVDRKSFVTAVKDGLLDIEVAHRVQSPRLSAIEIEQVR